MFNIKVISSNFISKILKKNRIKYGRIILKLYFYLYFKYCLNPIKYKRYYKFLTAISKFIIEIRKPCLFIINQFVNFKYFFFKEEEKGHTIVPLYLNNKKLFLWNYQLKVLVFNLLKSQNLIINPYENIDGYYKLDKEEYRDPLKQSINFKPSKNDLLMYSEIHSKLFKTDLLKRRCIIREFYETVYNSSTENQKEIHQYFDIFNKFEKKEIELFSEMINYKSLVAFPWFDEDEYYILSNNEFILPYDLYFFMHHSWRYLIFFTNTYENYLINQKLKYYYNRFIIEHPNLSLGFKKLLYDMPEFNRLDKLTYTYNLIHVENIEILNQNKIDYYFTDYREQYYKGPFFINKYIDTGSIEKNIQIKKDFIDFCRVGRFFNMQYVTYLIADEIDYYKPYISINRQHIHDEIFKLIQFFYKYFKFVLILTIIDLLFGLDIVKLFLFIFLLIGFIILLRSKSYIKLIKRIFILLSYGIFFSCLPISTTLLQLIVSFIVVKLFYFLIVKIGSMCFKLNYPQYQLINLLIDNIYRIVPIILRKVPIDENKKIEIRLKVDYFISDQYKIDKETMVDFNKYIKYK